MEWEIGPADEETMRRRQVLARSVTDDLAVAGLPIAPDHGLFRHVAASRAMRGAIAEILTAAGYTVLTDYNDLAPDQMKVTGHAPRTPSWRDWLVERHDERMQDAGRSS